ncbi:DUF1302 domain-containing protein [Thauera chlorobenzoica]|uniref:Uncharacterized protein n=1 Tax=Thauera chlorobenzoica TaxID=96773 RepID=A0A1H5Z8R3_9RHOO|nr:DUF1302 domain-containing protein [Thauera chlorobenzoica]APR04359.1 hypothetical protein Tchl_1500 [Thauera chlorobenzoica]SEG32692.1 Protein of unknown function [Thauera chlorobenzoica]
MTTQLKKLVLGLAVAGVCAPAAHAFQFESGAVRGSLDSTLTLGFGQRVEDQSCSHHGDVSTSCGDRANTAVWGNGDDGNLNYDKGDLFTAHLKGSHELLLSFPNEWKFMGRVGWLYDFAADETARTPLDGEAKRAVGQYARLYDLWVSKEFDIGERRGRVRFGNQVVSWGESLFMIGGINSNVAMDLQRLSSPGVQLKEAFLPSPAISFAAGLGKGVNLEAYYQFQWKPYSFPPSGTYFAQSDTFDKGRDDFLYFAPDPASQILAEGGRVTRSTLAAKRAEMIADGTAFPVLSDDEPGNSGQFGVSLKYRPEGVDVDLGFYYQRFHDKTPNVQYWNRDVTGTRMYFEEDRELYGISANTSIGNWAVGAELSYRPDDAVSLGVCMNMDGSGDGLEYGVECNSSIDKERYQLHLTGILSLTPGDHGWFLDLVGAQTATFLGEAVAIAYPGVNKNKVFTRSQNGIAYQQLPASGAWTAPEGVGDKLSWGYMFDFSLVYDSTIIPGWQVIPGVFFSHAVNGNTPNFMANWMEGAKSANFYVLFNRNPMTWQAGINYTTFWGGDHSFSAPYKDRDFVGGFISRNF